MSLPIHPELETKIRDCAEAEGLKVEAYLERLAGADQQAPTNYSPWPWMACNQASRSSPVQPTGKKNIAPSTLASASPTGERSLFRWAQG